MSKNKEIEVYSGDRGSVMPLDVYMIGAFEKDSQRVQTLHHRNTPADKIFGSLTVIAAGIGAYDSLTRSYPVPIFCTQVLAVAGMIGVFSFRERVNNWFTRP